MKLKFSPEKIIYILFSLIIILLSFYPTILNFLNTPKDHLYLGIHNYPPDYFVYLSEIEQSKRGALLITEKFTTEDQIGILFRPYYYISGKLAIIFKLSSIATYHLLRLLGCILLLIGSILWINKIFKKSFDRILAFFLILFSVSFPKILWRENPITIITYFNWWTGIDSLARWTFLPHHLISSSLLILFLYFFYSITEKNKTNFCSYILFFIFTFFLGLSSPIHLFIFNITIILFLLIKVISTKQIPKNIILLTLFIGLLSLFFIIYLRWVYQFSPWKEVNAWEENQNYFVSIKEYLLSIGLTSFLGIGYIISLPCFYLVNKKNIKPVLLLLIIFTILTIIFISFPIGKKFNFNPIRFVELPVFIPLAILSAFPLLFIKKKAPVIFYALIFIIIANTVCIFKISSDRELKEISKYFGYFSLESQKTMDFLAKNTSEKDIVLANPINAMYIPALSGNTVFASQPVTTLDFAKKVNKLNDFYSGNLSIEEAINWLNKNKIKYVYWSGIEKLSSNNLPEKYPFLIEFYKSKETAIFKIN